ncbi:MAG: hypothetical protein A2Z34_09585 [Planctomycetes bacterium RBG_16_59_8]|nr:MAG: hypothetical protein A2Z34_09585 [Planctomycetes bacterium RBG_16_59_8]
MITSDKVRSIAERVIPFMKKSGEGEVLFTATNGALTRFANNAISQNVAESNCEISVKAILGKRFGQVNVNQFDAEAIKTAFRKAVDLAKSVRPDSTLLPLLGKQKESPAGPFSEKTASAGPVERAAIVSRIVRKYKRKKLLASGTCSNGANAVALFNTNGLFAFHRDTSADLELTALIRDGAGSASDSSREIDRLQVDDVADRAMDKAIRSVSPGLCPAGDYTVILEEGAVCEILEFLGWVGFGALSFIENRSFLAGRLGQKVMGSNITIADDVRHPLMRGIPFDFEGMARQSLPLIERGIARSVVHDRLTAKRLKTRSTGHSLQQPNTMGPMPLNLVVSPGTSSVEEMIATTKKGIYVTKFHYTNVIDPKRVILTGMTRNGTFLVENGKITRPLKNMRFTESAVEAFNNVERISKKVKFVSAFFGGGFVVPSMKINNFTFSSETKF